MDKNSIKEISKKHNGKTFTFPIGALAENVETDEDHQFVTKEEKAQINKVESIEQAFRDGCDLLVSTCATYGETPVSNSPSDIANAIGEIYNKRYMEGYDEGESAASAKVKSVPVYATMNFNEEGYIYYFTIFVDGKPFINSSGHFQLDHDVTSPTKYLDIVET